MSNPVFNVLGGQQTRGGYSGIMSAVQAIKQNPLMFLLRQRFNVPSEILNDPNAILQHLLATGQINQNQINTAYQEIQNGGINYGR